MKDEMRAIRGNQSTSRTLNRLLVLNHLRRFGPTPRMDLAGATGLSSAAVTYVTAELLEQHFIVEIEGPNGRSTPLDLNYDGHIAIGVKLMETQLQAVLTDLGTCVVDTLVSPVDARDPASAVRAIADAVANLLASSRRPAAHLIGIGLGMPGQHDAARGICRRCHRFGWEEVPIGGLIAEATGSPVWIDNDVNAFALAEHLFGKGKTASSLAVMTFGRGTGAAMIVDGRLLRGHSGGAGEIGHIAIADDGPVCECGRSGCLEALTSLPAILAAHARLSRDPARDAEDLAARAAAGETAAIAVLGEAGHYLGGAAAMLLNLFDPEAFVIGGEGLRLGPALLDPLLATLHARCLARGIALHAETWGDDAWARGAAALAIDSFFSFPAADRS